MKKFFKENIAHKAIKTKILRIYFITLIVVIIILIDAIIITNMKKDNLYPAAMKVIKTDYITHMMTLEDGNGSLWQYKDFEDFMEGDGCAVLMDSNGTPEIEDDKIVQIRYTTTF